MLMIKKGSNITLRPYKTYKCDPIKSELIGYNENSFGKCLQFQVMDVNNTKKDKPITGFVYVNVHTSVPLKVGDLVTVKDILYVQRKINIVIVGITIEQTNPGVFEDDTCTVDGIIGEFDF